MIENEKWDYMVKNSKKQPKKPIGFVVSVLFFCVCLAVVISGVYAAQQQNIGTKFEIIYKSDDGYEFTLNEDTSTYTLTGFLKKDVLNYNAKIPATPFDDGYPVTAIDANVFEGSKIVSVTIPESVTSIGKEAFKDCTELTKINYNANISTNFTTSSNVFSNAGTAKDGITVIIGDNVEKIPNYLFLNVSKITSLTIGTGVKTLGAYAFNNCTGLTEINYNAINVANIGATANVFSGAGSAGEGITVTIGNSVTNIPAYLLYGRRSGGTGAASGVNYAVPKITSLTIGTDVKTIGTFAFYASTYLTEIKYNATNVTDLTNTSNVFYNAGKAGDGITATIGDNVTYIPAYLFYASADSYSPNIISLTIGTSVESIGAYAFQNCNSLTSIEIPASMQEIGDDAFYLCTNLKEVTNKSLLDIEAGETTHGYVAYYAENVITENSAETFGPFELIFVYDHYEVRAKSKASITGNIEIPAMYKEYPVTTIRASAFSDCTGITSLTIPENITSIGDSAFSGCTGLTEIKYNATNVIDLTSTSNVFYNAGKAGDGITVTIGNNVEKVPAYLFHTSNSSPNIINLTIGAAVESIGTSAFDGCSGLTSITIPEKVTSIGDQAFSGCTGLTEIIYNATNVADLMSSSGVFYRAGAAGDGITVTIGNNVEKIPAHLFYYGYENTGTNIISLSIGTSVNIIGASAFQNCSGLTTVTIPASVTSIENFAFYYCINLKEVTNKSELDIVAGETTHGHVAYYANKVIEKDGSVSRINPFRFTFVNDHYEVKASRPDILEGEIIIPAMYNEYPVTTIPSSAFSDCTGITSLTIPESITSIGYHAFYNCNGLMEIKYNATNAVSNSTAFSEAGKKSNGITVTIGDNVTHIPADLFDNVSNITSLTIGTGVETIGDSAFSGCIWLTEIKYNATNASSSGNVFYNAGTAGDGITVTIGDNVTHIPADLFATNGANYYQPKITSITIGSSVESIGSNAFHCYAPNDFAFNWSLNEVIINSANIYSQLIDIDACGNLIEWIESGNTIKVLQSADNGSNSYLNNTSTFTKTTEEINGVKYNVYTKI